MNTPLAMPVFAACFNRAYLPHTATMLRSFATTAVQPARWYLVGDDSVDDADLARLVGFVRGCGVSAEPLRVPDTLVAPFEDGARYPRNAWYRTAFAEMLPHEDRVVYVDSDTLVLQDLRALWEIPLGADHFFAALCTPSYGHSGVVNNGRLGLPPSAPYFNSGVMVMDLARMRAHGFRQQAVDFVLTSGRPTFPFPDQDVMNVVFAGRWTPLDPRWNCMTTILLPFILGASWSDDRHHDGVTLERAARSPAIVHFEGPPLLKPWNRRCFNPFAHLYRQYRATTPWPLEALEGRRRDVALARVPPRWLAKVWQYQAWRGRRGVQSDAGVAESGRPPAPQQRVKS